jgi:repressor LexA
MGLKLKIKEARKKAGLTGTQVAQMLGITSTHYYDIENGKKRAHDDLLLKLSEIFNVSVDFLLGKENKRPLEIYPVKNFERVPVLGVIRAGEPIYAEQNLLSYELVPEDEIDGGEYFYLRVKGDSMKNVGIFDGGFVLVRKQPVVDNGEIAVVIVNNDEATVKRFYRQNNSIILKPENPNYELQIYKSEEVTVLGKVVEAKRKF